MISRIERIHQFMEEHELDGLLIDSRENRFYLSGFTGTAGRILFTLEKDYFITDFRYTEQADEQTKGYEIVEVNQQQEEKLAELVKSCGVKLLGFEAKEVSYELFKKYSSALNGVDLIPVGDELNSLRMVKDSTEVDKIKKAIEITDLAFEHICNFIKTGITEREVALDLEFFMKKKGAEKNSFDFIVASGTRSSLPHGVATDKVLEKGDFVTMDFGTYYQGYCSDMTRTVVIGEPTEKQQEIYNIVLQAQLKVIEEIKVGMTCKDVDAIARDFITEAGYGDNFGHSLGHGIGVEIHEAPRLSVVSEQILLSGMVVTDEPGIYIPDWGGVRIEDDLLITEDGCDVLNNSPKELLML